MNRAFAVILCLCLLVPAVRAAADSQPEYTYELNDRGGVTITGYTGTAVDLDVPTTLDGYPVTRIGAKAFSSRTVQHIAFPDSVEYIEQYAIYDCSKLKTIRIPAGTSRIEPFAVSWCAQLAKVTVAPGSAHYKDIDGVLFDITGTALLLYPQHRKGTRYTVPEGVTEIGSGAFSNNAQLETVTLPDSLAVIGESAFSGCSALRGVSLPAGLKSIGAYAFDVCGALTKVLIPAGVGAVGHGAFRACLKLTAIEVAEGSAAFASRDGVLFSADGRTLMAYPRGKAGTKYTVPKGTEIIDTEAFTGCTKLKNVALSRGVTEIRDSAFSNCLNLEAVSLPDTLAMIGKDAFSECRYLKKISLPASVTSIGARAFDACASLRALTLGENVTDMGEQVFRDCRFLTVTVTPGSYAERYCLDNRVKCWGGE